ncbi:hypothetical protein C2E23DRAFT_887417 [Lenzites betulinus]|nr:hypothetical protein C2E23DRAFT_887417 [Lenzites betulinus]
MARGGYKRSTARSQNRVIIECSDDEALEDDTSTPASRRDSHEHPPAPHRPTRKSKEQAGKAWESLVPAKKRTQSQAILDDDTVDVVGSARKRQCSGPVTASQSAATLTAAKYPAPEVLGSEDDEPAAIHAPKSVKQRRKASEVTNRHSQAIKHSKTASQIRRFVDARKTLTDPKDHNDVFDGGDHEDTETADADEDEEDDAEGDDQQQDEEEEEADEDEDEEQEEVEDDEDPDEDDTSLARQFEAERATWTNDNTDGEPSNDEEFPDASTFMQASTKDSRTRPAKRIRSNSTLSENDEELTKSDESLHLPARLRHLAKRSREDSLSGSNPSDSDSPDRNARNVKSTPAKKARQMEKAPRTKSLKRSSRANAPSRTPSKPVTGSIPRSQATNTHRRGERQAGYTKLKSSRARPQETAEWLDNNDDDNMTATKPSPTSDDRAALELKSRVKGHKDAIENPTDSHSEEALGGAQSDSDSNVADLGIKLVDPGPKLALTNQCPCVKAVAHQAIEDVLIDVCLKNAFPEGPNKHNQFTRPTLIRVAKELKCSDIVQRLKTDQTYSRYLGSIRISTFRGKIKKHTDSVVPTTYGLNPGDGAKVDWLDHKLTYVYPHEYKTCKVKRHLPYSLSIFGQVMRAMWFSRPTSYGFKVMPKFSSSSLQFPREKEIPAPMLALVATAIYASIIDYSAPTYKAGDFTGNEFSDVYARNIRALQSIKDADVEKYHVLMHGFFKTLCGSHATVLSGSKYADDLDALDIAGMPGA